MNNPMFSIVMGTRNRADLLRPAIQSVLDQEDADFEIIVVNDGSDGDHRQDYETLFKDFAGSVTFIDNPPSPRGRGAGGARNLGGLAAKGTYLCFMDDDDTWTDTHHLARVAKIAAGHSDGIDVFFSKQQPFRNGVREDRIIWLNGLLEDVGNPLKSAGEDAYFVTVEDLMLCAGFAHLNTTIVKRELFLGIGMFDEANRYEDDRDLYLRIIDAADKIVFIDVMIAQHNIPDAAKQDSVSTMIKNTEKYLFQLRLLDRALLFSKQDAIKAYARKYKVWTLEKIAQDLKQLGKPDIAALYAREAASLRPGVKGTAARAVSEVKGLVGG